ncbi:hypothetical protein [Herbidospora cretacea]|nr:hypothetical protein [Herbidospora cretacea]
MGERQDATLVGSPILGAPGSPVRRGKGMPVALGSSPVAGSSSS